MSVEVDRLSLKIVSDGEQASSALERMASSLDKLANKTRAIKTLSKDLGTLHKALEGFGKEQAERLSTISAALKRMGNAKLPAIGAFAKELKSIQRVRLDGISDKIQEIANAVSALNQSSVNGDMSKLISDLAAVSQNAAGTSKAIKEAAAAVKTAPAAPAGPAVPSGDLQSNVDQATQSANRLRQSFSKLFGSSGSVSRAFYTLADGARNLFPALTKVGTITRKLPVFLNAAIHPLRTLRSLTSKATGVMSGITGGLGKATSGMNRFGLATLTSFGKLLKFRIMRVLLTNIFNGITTGRGALALLTV